MTIECLALDNTTSGKYPNGDIYLMTKTIDMSNLGSNSAIGITTYGLVGTVSSNVASGVTASCFTSKDASLKFVLSGTKLTTEAVEAAA